MASRLGPMALQEVIQRIQQGSIARSDLVWKTGAPGWAPAESYPELAQAFSGGPPPLPPAGGGGGRYRRRWRWHRCRAAAPAAVAAKTPPGGGGGTGGWHGGGGTGGGGTGGAWHRRRWHRWGRAHARRRNRPIRRVGRMPPEPGVSGDRRCQFFRPRGAFAPRGHFFANGLLFTGAMRSLQTGGLSP